MDITVPGVLKTLIDKINSNRGLGLSGLLANWDLFSRAGALVGKDGFLAAIAKVVEDHEAAPATETKPTARERAREQLRAFWQKALSEFFGFAVEVPLPPALNRKQERALRRYGFLILFLPAFDESRYPEHAMRPAWGKHVDVGNIERIPLSGKWVAVETVRKPNYGDGAYPEDRLMADLWIASRFNHPYSGKGEGDDIVEDILPKVAEKVGFARDQVMATSEEEWNLVANLFNWLREHRNMQLPDLGATDAWEWCRNASGSDYGLLAGDRDVGGLSAVRAVWRVNRFVFAAFRVLVVLG